MVENCLKCLHVHVLFFVSLKVSQQRDLKTIHIKTTAVSMVTPSTRGGGKGADYHHESNRAEQKANSRQYRRWDTRSRTVALLPGSAAASKFKRLCLLRLQRRRRPCLIQQQQHSETSTNIRIHCSFNSQPRLEIY